MGPASRLALAGAFFFLSSHALAQTPDLDRARATFTEALADQEARRFAVALEKYRQVAEVRDTAQVQYRIGMCLEALGQRRLAIVAYDRASHLGRGDAQAQEVVTAANERIASLANEMGKLGIGVRGSDAFDVRIDGVPISADELGSAVVLEPGEHVVEVTATHMKPARATVNLVRGKRLDLTVALVPEKTIEQLPPPPPPSHTRQNVGIVLVATGAAFAIGTGLTLWWRNDLIDTIKTDCPGNVCPFSRYSEIEGMRSTATTLGPLAAVLGGVALAAAGTGIVLVALGPQKHLSAALAPSSFVLRGTF